MIESGSLPEPTSVPMILPAEECNGTCPCGPPKILNGRPGRRPSALDVIPPVGFGRVEDKNAEFVGDDLFYCELGGRAFASARFSENGDVLL